MSSRQEVLGSYFGLFSRYVLHNGERNTVPEDATQVFDSQIGFPAIRYAEVQQNNA